LLTAAHKAEVIWSANFLIKFNKFEKLSSFLSLFLIEYRPTMIPPKRAQDSSLGYFRKTMLLFPKAIFCAIFPSVADLLGNEQEKNFPNKFLYIFRTLPATFKLEALEKRGEKFVLSCFLWW
jgi:hypothetical protein